uniref:Nucleolar complex protein 2 homolog n=1 Tax=Angiostrongylus cantonensis TaxID=6313 RepID=A0A0K0CWV7_ANGCA
LLNVYIFQFVNEVQASDIIVTTLKAILRIVDLYALFKRLTKKLSKVLVRIWSRKTLDCRVGAYVCMTKLVKNHPEHFVVLYKCCYLGFVSNSRVVTNTTWPLLHFAHRTFAELTVLHPNLAYPYAFVYIRQIAIHLRNATISKKRKDMVQTVYNWQVMQCLYLWTRVVSKAHFVSDCEAISELTYPLIQVIYGILKLYQSLRYIPLRLHCISLLIQLQANFSSLLFVLAHSDKEAKSIKDYPCHNVCLKVNAFVLEEISWRKSLCEHLFRILLQAAHLVCAQPCFPDVIVPITFRVLLFKIRSGEFVRCFRALLEKLEEHAKYIADVLLIREFKLKDDMQILALKSGLSDPNSPFRIYYRQWENVWRIRQGAQGSTTKKIHKPAVTPRVPKDETIPDEFGDLGNWSDSD